MVPREIHAIPKAGGGVTVFQTVGADTTWLVDLFEDLEVKQVSVETLIRPTGTVFVIAAGSLDGVYVTQIQEDGLFTEVTYTSPGTISTQQLAYGTGSFETLRRIEASVTHLSELNIRVYSLEEAGFHVDSYVEGGSGLVLDSARSETVLLSGLTGVGGTSNPTEPITDVFTILQAFETPSGIPQYYDLPVIVTADTAYLVHKNYSSEALFSGNCSEILHKSLSYSSLHFGGTEVFDEIRNLLISSAYTEKAKDGIFFLGDTSSGETSINLLRFSRDADVLISSSDLAAVFSGLAEVSVMSPITDRLGTPGSAGWDASILKAYSDVIYLRTGVEVLEVWVSDSGLTAGQSLNLDGAIPHERYSVCEAGLAQLDQDVFVIHSFGVDLSAEGEPESDSYTTKQNYTATVLDKQSVASEHPVLMGTQLDNQSNTAIGEILYTGEFTGQYASEAGYTFLSQSDKTVILKASGGDSGAAIAGQLSTAGVLVDGADFVSYGERRTILMYVDSGNSVFYCISYATGVPVLCQITHTAAEYAAMTGVGSDTLLVTVGTVVYSALVSAFGLAEPPVGTIFSEVLDVTAAEWNTSGDSIQAIHGYSRSGIDTIVLAAGNFVVEYRVTHSTLTEGFTKEFALDTAGLSSISGIAGETLVRWSAASVETYDMLQGTLTKVSEVPLPAGASVAASEATIVVSQGDQAVVYRKNRELTESDTIYESSIQKSAVAVVGPILLLPNHSDRIGLYSWWTGIAPEVYFDNAISTFHVPLRSVDFADNPPYYDRAVIERDEKYQEPITVAYDTTSPDTRARQVVSNRRLSFLGRVTSQGDQVLSMSPNTTKLLRNSVMWCLNIDADTLVGDDVIVEDAEEYAYPEHINSAYNDVFSMAADPVCGDLTRVERILEDIPVNGILVAAEHLPGKLQEAFFFENTNVKTYVREIPDSEQLRVEFGEYSGKKVRGVQYTTPGYATTTTGIVGESGEAYAFWDALWEQSEATGTYLSELLDLRKVADGEAKETDITPYVNPAKLLLTHFLADAVITIIRLKPRSVDIEQELLDMTNTTTFEELAETKSTAEIAELRITAESSVVAELLEQAKEDMESVPWLHINKTLPAGSKCVTVYVVESSRKDPETINPEL